MKRLMFIAALSLSASSAFGYSIHGSSDTHFVLMCNDGTKNISSMPPNHNTAVEFCKDHGGIAAGYPKKIVNAMKNKSKIEAGSIHSSSNHNTTRSNRIK